MTSHTRVTLRSRGVVALAAVSLCLATAMAGGLLVSIAIWTASALHREFTARAGWRQLTVVGEPVSIASCLEGTCLACLARSRLTCMRRRDVFMEIITVARQVWGVWT